MSARAKSPPPRDRRELAVGATTGPSGASGPEEGRGGPRAAVRSALDLAVDEVLDGLAGLVVEVLHRRRLHEVARGRQDRATDAAVLRDLRRAQGVDDDAGRVRGVPDLELVLEVQRHV